MMCCEKCNKDYDAFTMICPHCGGITVERVVPEPVEPQPYAYQHHQQPQYTPPGTAYAPPGYQPPQYPQYAPYSPPQADNPTAAWKVLGFFVPLAGLILYAVWKDEKPLTARALGKFALIGFIVNFVFSLLIGLLSFVVQVAGSF